jgi:hypothetical protein
VCQRIGHVNITDGEEWMLGEIRGSCQGLTEILKYKAGG